MNLQARPSGDFLFRVTRNDHPWSLSSSKSNAFKMRFKPTLGFNDPASEHATRRSYTKVRPAYGLSA